MSKTNFTFKQFDFFRRLNNIESPKRQLDFTYESQAKAFKVNKRTISRWLKKAMEAGYIIRERVGNVYLTFFTESGKSFFSGKYCRSYNYSFSKGYEQVMNKLSTSYEQFSDFKLSFSSVSPEMSGEMSPRMSGSSNTSIHTYNQKQEPRTCYQSSQGANSACQAFDLGSSEKSLSEQKKDSAIMRFMSQVLTPAEEKAWSRSEPLEHNKAFLEAELEKALNADADNQQEQRLIDTQEQNEAQPMSTYPEMDLKRYEKLESYSSESWFALLSEQGFDHWVSITSIEATKKAQSLGIIKYSAIRYLLATADRIQRNVHMSQKATLVK